MKFNEPSGKYGKDAYYFPHDSNAKDDPKIIQLVEQLGLEGYGIFWVLIEILREQPDYRYPLAAVPGLARRYSTTTEKVKVVIHSFNLFEIDEEMFFSPAFSRRMGVVDLYRKQQSEYGKIGRQMQLSGVPQGSPGQGKERKGKESKVKEIKENDKKELILPFSSPEFLEVWNLLLTEKKWKNKSFNALQLSLNKIAPLNELEAIRCIQNTIAGSWQGLFPDSLKTSKSGLKNDLTTLTPIEATLVAYEKAKGNMGL